MMRNAIAAGLIAATSLAACASKEQKESIEKTNEGVKAIKEKHYDEAVSKLTDATSAYKDNYTAWYNLGIAYDEMKKYDDASKSYEQAVRLSGKDAMYHMKLGIARYMSILDDGRKHQATVNGVDPSTITDDQLDLKGANFDPAIQELQAAISINPDLYRAYYYEGLIYEWQDDAAKAADAFTSSIKSNPRYGQPYVTLGELYRKWGYYDEALQVLKQGKDNLPGDVERPQVLFALGMAYYLKKDYPNAITEFSGALEEDKNLHLAQYQRGMAEIKTKDWDKAKSDLEAYGKNAKDDYTKGVAQKSLMDIMAAQNAANGGGGGSGSGAGGIPGGPPPH
jgi:tetratricopeptide (TPR) repeat protein